MINDYEALANNGMSADRLASTFFKEYFKNSTPTFPINPFQMLTDLGIPFYLGHLRNMMEYTFPLKMMGMYR